MPMAGCHKSRGKYIVTGEPCENAEIGTKGQQQVLTAFRVVDIFNPPPPHGELSPMRERGGSVAG